MSASVSANTKKSHDISQWLYFLAITYAVVSFGGADLVTQSVLTLMLIMIFILNIRDNLDSRHIFTLWMFAVFLLFALVGVAFIQSVRLGDHPFEHSIWRVVRDNLGPVDGAISVAPEQTRASLVAFSPLLAFILSLTLFQTLAHALTMLKRLSYFSAAVAFYGIMQHLLFPLQLGFGEKSFYLDSLTAFFVNRNSAGTFFGVGTILTLSFAFYYFRLIDQAKLIDRLLKPWDASTQAYQMFAIFFLLSLLQGVALFLTQSRAAAGSTFIAIVLFILLAAEQPLSRPGVTLSAGLARSLRVGAMVLVVIGIFLLFAGQATYRQEAEGGDQARLCVFKSTIAAIGDNWTFGTGFGTFPNVFPAYRNADCAGVGGIWDAAHNSFLEGTLGLGVIFPVIVAAGIALLVGTFWFGVKVRHRYRFVPIMGLSVLLLICLHSTVDFSMEIPGVSLFVATIFGCCCGISLEREPAHQQVAEKLGG